MGKFLRSNQVERIILLCLIIITATSVGFAQRKKSKLAPAATSNTPVQPQLLNADSNPTLRCPIARVSMTVSSASYGWLDVTRRGVQYTVQQPANKVADGFSVSTAEVSDLKLNERTNSINFRAGGKKEDVFYVAQESWGSMRSGREYFALIAEGTSGTQSIYKTLLSFEAMLALVKASSTPPAPVIAAPIVPASPQPAPAAPPPPPAIVVASPSGAGANQTVESQESPLVIRGVAMDTTGIPVVSINGSPANMRPQNTQAAEFWSDPLPLQPGDNQFRISATNAAHVETKLAFTVHYAAKAAPVNPKALDKAEIISLLQGAVPAARVAGIVRDRGIKFVPTADDLDQIRAAGGDDELIQAIQQATPPK